MGGRGGRLMVGGDPVWVVDLVGESDPLYLFLNQKDADEFYEAAQEAGREVVKSEEPLIDHSTARGLIVTTKETA